jgi:flagellar biogenesis protein FliO
MFNSLFGSGMPLSARFFIAFVIVLGLIGLAAWLVRRFGANRFGAGGTRGRQPRLAVIDATVIDGRRRLVLIRRDNIEHLLMIGGPTDVVIEPNIIRVSPARDTSAHPAVGVDNWPRQPLNEPATVQRNYSRIEPGLRAPIAPLAEPASDQKNAAHSDQHLAEMALQLETSFRKKPKSDNSRPAVIEPLTALHSKPLEPVTRAATPAPEFDPSAEPKAGPPIEPRFEPALDIHPVIEFEPKTKAASDFVANGPAQFAPAPAALNKHHYDNLEEEMATLLGRSKTDVR